MAVVRYAPNVKQALSGALPHPSDTSILMTDSPTSDLEEVQRAIALERSMNGDSRDLAAELIEERRADADLEERLLADPVLMASIKFSIEHPETHVRRSCSNSSRL